METTEHEYLASFHENASTAELVDEAVEILTERSDGEDENSVVYPLYIKQEEPQQPQYASGDDESMAVEALRQLGGMYPVTNTTTVPGDVKFSCPTCCEKFERKIDLNNHMVCHQIDRPHACRTCGNLFRSKSTLQTHMAQVHHIDKPHKCSICGSDFQRPSSLSNHMKIHTYVAGRALTNNHGNSLIIQAVDSISESPEVVLPSTSTNYETQEVQWSVPSYTFQNDQATVDTLHEFTVMPNGEITQFEYTQPNTANNTTTTTTTVINQFNIETLPYVTADATSETKSHSCNHCGLSFARPSSLSTHEKTCASKVWVVPIECEFCDKQFQDNSHLASHQKTCSKKLMQNFSQDAINSKWGKHACAECGKKFTTKQKMFRHQWIHRKKTHSCEVCGVQFEKQNQLDEHRLAAHPGDSPYTCSECGKSFVSRQGLWEHGRTHAGSPAHFHCDTCSKTFSSRQGYLIHHRTHTGERPYGCKFCWKAFRDGGTLRKHERIHTGERPHVCPLCSRAFNQKVVLREHVRWVHAAGKNDSQKTGPPFPCPLCGNLNQDRDELCAHIVKHSDKMIADAKAKTNNNASKPKIVKKKPPKAVGLVLVTDKQTNQAAESMETSDSSTVVQVVQYLQDSDNEVEELVCGICGDDFNDKNILMEHVKIHI